MASKKEELESYLEASDREQRLLHKWIVWLFKAAIFFGIIIAGIFLGTKMTSEKTINQATRTFCEQMFNLTGDSTYLSRKECNFREVSDSVSTYLTEIKTRDSVIVRYRDSVMISYTDSTIISTVTDTLKIEEACSGNFRCIDLTKVCILECSEYYNLKEYQRYASLSAESLLNLIIIYQEENEKLKAQIKELKKK